MLGNRLISHYDKQAGDQQEKAALELIEAIQQNVSAFVGMKY